MTDEELAQRELDERIAIILDAMFRNRGKPVEVRCDMQFGKMAREELLEQWREQTAIPRDACWHTDQVLDGELPIDAVLPYLRSVQGALTQSVDAYVKDTQMQRIRVANEAGGPEVALAATEKERLSSPAQRRQVLATPSIALFQQMISELANRYDIELDGIAAALFLLTDANILVKHGQGYMLPLDHKSAETMREEVTLRVGSWPNRIRYRVRKTLRIATNNVLYPVLSAGVGAIPHLLGLS